MNDDDDDDDDDTPPYRDSQPSDEGDHDQPSESAEDQTRRQFGRAILTTAVAGTFAPIVGDCNSRPTGPQVSAQHNRYTNTYTRKQEAFVALPLEGPNADKVSLIDISPTEVNVSFHDGTSQRIPYNDSPSSQQSKVLLNADSGTERRNYRVRVHNQERLNQMTVYFCADREGVFTYDVAMGQVTGDTILSCGNARLRCEGLSATQTENTLSVAQHQRSGRFPPFNDDRMAAHSNIIHAGDRLTFVTSPMAAQDALMVKRGTQYVAVPTGTIQGIWPDHARPRDPSPGFNGVRR